MALSRRSGQRFQTSIWPGFVDAMTALLLVLMFVLTVFMIVQYVLQETISNQDDELNELAAQVSGLSAALGLEQQRNFQLETEVGQLSSTLTAAEEQAAAQSAAAKIHLTIAPACAARRAIARLRADQG